MKTFIDLFSGGGGAALGAKQAGLQPVFGLELKPEIAKFYNKNIGHHHCHVGDVRTFDYSSLDPPFWLHASPPCVTASQANAKAFETPLDLELANTVCQAISILNPRRFSLENVANYRNYQSFKHICYALQTCGYKFDHWLLDAADFGVPQNRKRLILVARKCRKPIRPQPTHHNPKSGQTDLFRQPWNGWYDAVNHRIHEFQSSQWANWQIPRLPSEIRDSFLVGGANTNLADAAEGRGVRYADEPCPTIAANAKRNINCFLMHSTNAGADGHRYCYEDEPSFTVLASHHGVHRAWLVSGTDGTSRHDRQPSFTITASQGEHGTRPKAQFASGVYRLSVGALADIQSFPPSYKLPPTTGLAMRIIGNAVPPLLMQRVIEANL